MGCGYKKCVFISFANKCIIFCWVSSHVGIRVNKKADLSAKLALDLSPVSIGVFQILNISTNTVKWVLFTGLETKL